MPVRRIVAVARNPRVSQLAQQFGQEVFVADDLPEAIEIVDAVSPDLVLFDHQFGPADIRHFINTTDKNSVNVPVVVVGNKDACYDLSADFIRAGACDFIRGEQDYDRLSEIINRLQNDAQKKVLDFFADDFAASVSLVGQSSAIRNTLRMIKLVAASTCNPILVVGETGTGKELVAKAIHILRHPQEPFVAVNCAALTASLLESELFGHVKGSFTGADKEKTGLLELAGSGSLFLDEISEMPTDLQAKLLRVLQEKNFRKVGGTENIECNAAIIVSSNRDLKKEVQANRFRHDLFYRLNTVPIFIAPLRAPQRRADIRILAHFFIKTSNICPKKHPNITSITEIALEMLEKHHWPGNVRELRNVIERAILLETTDKIGLSSILIDPPQFFDNPADYTTAQPKDFSLERAERELIARALRETGWQKTRAAALLGITRATLYAKVKQYNIEIAPNQQDNSPNQFSSPDYQRLQNHPVPVSL
jgi:DNA-binding NtrC family response regulator